MNVILCLHNKWLVQHLRNESLESIGPSSFQLKVPSRGLLPHYPLPCKSKLNCPLTTASLISTAKPQLMLLSLMQAQVIANNIHSHWYFCLNIKAHCLGQYVSKCIYKLKTTLKPFLWSQQLWTNNFRTNSKTVCNNIFPISCLPVQNHK